MPSATNLTVKNAANADVVFTLDTGASGNGGIASWVAKLAYLVRGSFPLFTAVATSTPTSQNLKTKLVVPVTYTDSTSGMPIIITEKFSFVVNSSMPNSIPEALRDDCVAYAVNLHTTALLKAMIRDGLPAT